MPTRRFLYVLCLVAWGLLGGLSAAQNAAEQDYHLFLLVGQSNMAGRGPLAPQSATESPELLTHPRVKMLDRAGQWQPARDPLHFDKPKAVGVGPGLSFAMAYAEAHPQATVGLIPCAVGGSPIDAWQPGAYYPPTNSHPYDDALARTHIAQRSGTLQGILWHQGESDAKPELSEAYAGKLAELIARFRHELGAVEVPFLVGQMGQFSERPWDADKIRVDLAHRQADRTSARVAFVSSDGLGHLGDEIHFSTEAARELGRRYYAAWQALQR